MPQAKKTPSEDNASRSVLNPLDVMVITRERLQDTLDDAVNKTYCGIPSRLYLIDSERKIAYKSGRGPFGFKPAELEQSLVMLLDQDATGTSSTAKEPSPAAASPALRERGGSVSARRRD